MNSDYIIVGVIFALAAIGLLCVVALVRNALDKWSRKQAVFAPTTGFNFTKPSDAPAPEIADLVDKPVHDYPPLVAVSKPSHDPAAFNPYDSEHMWGPESTTTYAEAAPDPDGEPAVMTIPEAVEAGAIQPPPSWQKGLEAANKAHSIKAKERAQAAAGDLEEGYAPDLVAQWHKYPNADAMRKALSRHGYKSNGQPKEVQV